ncbi:hypothetical protein Pcinc_023080 [Petrolisthes cinctipes]|uniref:Bifunctional peptidase and (3S)-lysyl hydroxylase JMJD7 n=1 Tax=Petrolisthes cinctipes TaxID=88211 RepID=A0AAE1KG72_PETCI|nr:hypothetical protein Pcinc_023080 [Petrolisthes cinctipes]
MSDPENVINPEPSGIIRESLLKLSEEAQELYLSSQVPILDAIPTPLELYRDWIAPNKPVIFRDAVKFWPAVDKWSPQYLRETVGKKEVSVAVTPNGYADAPNGGYFVMPEERTMLLSSFLDVMENPGNQPGVFYVQKQNSNFTDEFPELICDAAPDIPWFTEALGKAPDAVNFWMGDERAVTSMHKDHYENVYCVVSGHKDFILLPPTDVPWVPYANLPPATYKEINPGEFVIEENPGEDVPWISIDPLKPDIESYPQYKHASPIRCRVEAGDAMYLPSLWFHHVRQSHACIAVNYWYDMEYDLKYNYYTMLQNLTWRDKPGMI